jgi:D-alanyl-D-alanine carboxypeptidase
MRNVALPGYSEHGYPPRQAIDFITADGISFGPEKVFDETQEYGWLLKNAQKFGFYLSYPKNNKQEMAFEPWHWHYKARPASRTTNKE